jgi:hypothetical protein
MKLGEGEQIVLFITAANSVIYYPLKMFLFMCYVLRALVGGYIDCKTCKVCII